MKSIKEGKLSVLILSEKDFTKFSDDFRGLKYDYIFVPKSIKEQFLLSELRIVLQMCFKNLNNFNYYE